MAPRIENSAACSSYHNDTPRREASSTTMPSRLYDDGDDANVDQELSSPISVAAQKHHRRRNDINTEGSDRAIRYANLGRQRFGAAYQCMVACSVLIYWTFVSLVPVYNKHFFQASLYPYPIATAGIQLGVVAVLLAALNAVQHYFFPSHQSLYHRRMSFSARGRGSISSGTKEEECRHSWIFGPHFWWKVKWCFPLGALFGLKYGFTNLGLHLVPAPTHLLLQSTDLVWTVLGAWWINGEVVSVVELFCLAGCVAGSMVLGWQLEVSTLVAPLFAIVINLLSPMLLGLCLATLRLACIELMRPDNRVGGTVSAVELTSIKLFVSSAVALVLACAMESGDEDKASWWASFVELSRSTRWGVMGGALLISVFQVNCTFLTFLTSAVVLGLVGQVKIIPQWILAAISANRTSNFKIHSMNLVGACLIMASAAAFALSNWLSSSTSTQTCECDHDVIQCDCFHHDHHPGDGTAQANDDDDEERAFPLAAGTGWCGQAGEGNHAEGKSLLMLGEASEWGAAYLQKNYSAIEDDQEIVGWGPAAHLEPGIGIPLLTASTRMSQRLSQR